MKSIPKGIIVILLGICAGCADIIDQPTAPSSWTPATPGPAIVLQLTPAAPDPASGVAHLGIRAIAADGNDTHADVRCSASSGRVTPAQFDPRSRGALELSETTIVSRVSCSAGDITASIDVDMSAWWIDLGGNKYVPIGDGAGESRVTVSPKQRIRSIEATRVQLDWGDGTPIEVLPYVPASTPATRFHAYRRSGSYVITGRIEWPGGAHERRLSVLGGPPGTQP